MKKKLFLASVFAFFILTGHSNHHDSKPEPVTEMPWKEVVISVTDLDRTAEFFKRIGGFWEIYRGESSESAIKHYGLTSEASAEELLLAAEDSEAGFIRLIRFDNAGYKAQMRPGSRAWDTGRGESSPPTKRGRHPAPRTRDVGQKSAKSCRIVPF